MNYNNKLKSVINDYKRNIGNPPVFDNSIFSMEYRQQKIDEYLDKTRANALIELESLQSSVTDKILSKTKSVNELKFPLLTSYASQSRGELQRNEALNLSKEKNLQFDKIIQDSEKLSRFDFIYSLQDFINQNLDSNSDIRNLVNNEVNKISEKRGITAISNDIENLEKFNEYLTASINMVTEPNTNNKVIFENYFNEVPEIIEN